MAFRQRDGEVVWKSGDFLISEAPPLLIDLDGQARGFARASLLHADGKTIIVDEDGDLALARLTPDGLTVLARTSLFETVAWSASTLVGTTLYVRDREKIVALDLGAD